MISIFSKDPSSDAAFPSRMKFKHRPSTTEMEKASSSPPDAKSTMVLNAPLTEVLNPQRTTFVNPKPKTIQNPVRATRFDGNENVAAKVDHPLTGIVGTRVDDGFGGADAISMAVKTSTTSTTLRLDSGLGARTSTTSLSSLGSFQSEASSVIHRRQRKNNFKALLAEREFEILSRKTKFLLSVFSGGKLRFICREEG